MRLSVTIPDQLLSFVQHLRTRRGMSVSAALCYVIQSNPEFNAYEKDQARQAADAAKAPVKTTTVVEPKPTREQVLEQERYERIYAAEAAARVGEASERERGLTPVDPPRQAHKLAGKEANCHHGNQISDSEGYQVFCFECAVESGIEVCHEHRSAMPCFDCDMTDEAAL